MKFPRGWINRALILASLTTPGFAAQTVTVDLNSTKQSIRGFGGMIHRVWQGYDLTASDRDLAFGNGPGQIGLSVLRIPVYENESDWGKELTTAKDVISRGGIVYASPWDPPASLQTAYSFVRWGTTYNSSKISASNYGAYVTHLNKFAKYMKDNGAPLYAISIQNEPDWCDSWTCWSADEVYNFVKSNAADLRQNGTKVITAESFSYSKSYYDQILNDAAALANIDIIGAHFYGSVASTANSFFQYALADQKASSKERWMTEHYTDSKGSANLWRGYIITGDQDQTPTYDTVRALDVAYEIHRAMVEGNFNQYTWWYIRRNYGLIMHDATANVNPAPTAAEAGKVSKRGYCVAQYAKFVRPGAVRVEATKQPDTYVFVSAYKRADSVIIVAVNRAAQNSISFSVPAGTSITSWKKYTTSETKNVNDDGSVTATNGGFTVSLDKESVTTLVGVIPSSQSSSSSIASSSSSTPSSSSSVIPQGPYSGSAAAIPGKIEAEDYDVGGEGIAYHDVDSINSGSMYRTDGVDVTGDATDGYKLGWTIAGEWTEYTVNVASATSYSWEVRVASGVDNSSFRILLDSTDISTSIVVPNTGDWDTYSNLTGTTTQLPAGNHVLRIVVEGSYFNLDWIQFSDPTVALSHQQPGTVDSQRYRVYTLQGVEIGSVQMHQGEAIHAKLRSIVPRPGLYVVKPVSAANSLLVHVTDK